MSKNKNTKKITLQEYAANISPSYFRSNRKYPDRQITLQALKHRIKKGIPLPLVIKIEQSNDNERGRYFLTVGKDFGL